MSDYPFDTETAARPQPEHQAAAPHAPQNYRHADSEQPDDAAVPLLQYVKVLYKRRWTAVTIFLLVVGGVTLQTFTAIPIFQARTRLLIETDQNVVTFKAVLDGDQTRADNYQTQYNILQ